MTHPYPPAIRQLDAQAESNKKRLLASFLLLAVLTLISVKALLVQLEIDEKTFTTTFMAVAAIFASGGLTYQVFLKFKTIFGPYGKYSFQTKLGHNLEDKLEEKDYRWVRAVHHDRPGLLKFIQSLEHPKGHLTYEDLGGLFNVNAQDNVIDHANTSHAPAVAQAGKDVYGLANSTYQATVVQPFTQGMDWATGGSYSETLNTSSNWWDSTITKLHE